MLNYFQMNVFPKFWTVSKKFLKNCAVMEYLPCQWLTDEKKNYFSKTMQIIEKRIIQKCA